MIPIKDVQLLVNSLVYDNFLSALRLGIISFSGRSALYSHDYVAQMDAPSIVRVYCDLWELSGEMRQVLLERIS